MHFYVTYIDGSCPVERNFCFFFVQKETSRDSFAHGRGEVVELRVSVLCRSLVYDGSLYILETPCKIL